MKDVDKIIQIFESGQYKLALELANGIKLNHLDLMRIIYDKNLQEVTDVDYGLYKASIFGDFQITPSNHPVYDANYEISHIPNRISINKLRTPILTSTGYDTLQECFKTILYKIEVLY